MGCSREVVAPGKVACGIEAGNCSEMFLSLIVSRATNFKDISVKGFIRRDIMTSVFASIA